MAQSGNSSVPPVPRSGMARRASGAQNRNGLSGVGWQKVAGGAEPEEPGKAAGPPPARRPSRPHCPRGQYFEEEQHELVCELHSTGSGYCCEDACLICGDALTDPVCHEEINSCRQLFCSKCLYGWLNRLESRGEVPKCPTCRARIDNFPRSDPGPQGAPDAPFVPADAPGARARPAIDANDPWAHRLALLGIPAATPDLLLPVHAPRLQLYYVDEQVYAPLNVLPPLGSTPLQAIKFLQAILRMDIAALRGYREGWEAATGRPMPRAAVEWSHQRLAAADGLEHLINDHLGPQAVQSQAGFNNDLLESVAFYFFVSGRLNSVLAAGYAEHVLHEAGASNAVAQAFAHGLVQVESFQNVRRPYIRTRCDLASGDVSGSAAFFLPEVMTYDTDSAYMRAAVAADVIVLQVYTLGVALAYARTSSEIDLVNEYIQCLQACPDPGMIMVAAEPSLAED